MVQVVGVQDQGTILSKARHVKNTRWQRNWGHACMNIRILPECPHVDIVANEQLQKYVPGAIHHHWIGVRFHVDCFFQLVAVYEQDST